MSQKTKIIEREEVVIRFSGDSGDGMQLTGTQFSDTSALFGNDVATFPDYPAEIRAPQGTVGGVSSDGLNTIALPAASAGADFHMAICIG